MPSWIRPRSVANENRTHASSPNASPGTAATWASASSRSQNAADPATPLRRVERRDVGERVEGALRPRALGRPRRPRGPSTIASRRRAYCASMLGDRLVRRARGRSGRRARRPARSTRRSRSSGSGTSRDRGDELLRPERPAQAPSSHRVGLRRGAGDDDAVVARPERRGRDVAPAVVEEAVVGLVEDRARRRAPRTSRGSARARPCADDRARRVVGRVEDHAARLRAAREPLQRRGRRLPARVETSVGRTTGVAPARRTISGNETQYGEKIATSSPSSNSAWQTLKTACFAPAVTMHVLARDVGALLAAVLPRRSRRAAPGRRRRRCTSSCPTRSRALPRGRRNRGSGSRARPIEKSTTSTPDAASALAVLPAAVVDDGVSAAMRRRELPSGHRRLLPGSGERRERRALLPAATSKASSTAIQRRTPRPSRGAATDTKN